EWQRPLSFRRQLLQLSDGGAVALDWQNEGSPPGPVVLFLTGLTSDSQAYYLRTLVPMVASTQRPCVVANYRGQGDVPLVNHRLVCALSIHDLAEHVQGLGRRRHPGGGPRMPAADTANVFKMGPEGGGTNDRAWAFASDQSELARVPPPPEVGGLAGLTQFG
ncbi:hypothetical protein HPB47_024421, partial [Ixodes persulcatus]